MGDSLVGEQVREVVGPELLFCKDHNLLMYPKAATATSQATEFIETKHDISSISESESSYSDSSSEDTIEDVEDCVFQ